METKYLQWIRDFKQQPLCEQLKVYRQLSPVEQRKLDEVLDDLSSHGIFHEYSEQGVVYHLSKIKEHKELFQHIEQLNTDIIEKWILGVSGASLLLTIFKVDQNMIHLFLIKLSWFFFAVSIVGSVTSALLGIRSARHELGILSILESNYLSGKGYSLSNLSSNPFNKYIILINRANIISFVLAIVSLCTFAILQLQ